MKQLRLENKTLKIKDCVYRTEEENLKDCPFSLDIGMGYNGYEHFPEWGCKMITKKYRRPSTLFKSCPLEDATDQFCIWENRGSGNGFVPKCEGSKGIILVSKHEKYCPYCGKEIK